MNNLKRHTYKTISYRLLGILTTVIITFFLGVPLEISSLLGIGELTLKPIIYFIHERVWFKYIRFKK